MQCLAIVILWLNAPLTDAHDQVKDDLGNIISLPHAAQRIITLPPHLTELIFSLSAGKKLSALWIPAITLLPYSKSHVSAISNH